MQTQVEELVAEALTTSDAWLEVHFPAIVKLVQRYQVWKRQGDNTSRLPPHIAASTIDETQWCAAWILFTHPEVTQFGKDGVWQAGLFRYEIWAFDTQNLEPTLRKTIEITRERRSPQEMHPSDVAVDLNEIAIENGSISVRGLHTEGTWYDFPRVPIQS